MNYKWVHDRNNFLLLQKDSEIFSQLPSDCQRMLYTDFIFQEFIYKFRRFFSFRIDQVYQKEIIAIDPSGTNDCGIGKSHGSSLILNKNLRLLKKKVQMMMNITRAMKNKDKTTQEEKDRQMDIIRQKVDEFERKQ